MGSAYCVLPSYYLKASHLLNFIDETNWPCLLSSSSIICPITYYKSITSDELFSFVSIKHLSNQRLYHGSFIVIYRIEWSCLNFFFLKKLSDFDQYSKFSFKVWVNISSFPCHHPRMILGGLCLQLSRHAKSRYIVY